MKKLIFISVFVFASMISFDCISQWYGQQLYSTDSIFTSSGKIVKKDSGYVIGGYRPVRQSGSNSPDFVIYKTDKNGQFTTANDFAVEYQFYDGCNLISPNNCNGVSVIETNNLGMNEAYALAASYDRGLVFATLDPQGNITQFYSWDYPSYTSLYKKPTVRESSTAGYYYICGSYRFDSAYVFLVNANTNPIQQVWGNFYTTLHMEPNDLMESPYNPTELIVIGRSDTPPTARTAADGFFMKLDAGSGGVSTYTTYNKQWGGDDWFNCIEVAKSTYGGSDGYILGGRSIFGDVPPPCNCTINQNRAYVEWMCKLDRDGDVLWSTLVEPFGASTYTAGWTGFNPNQPIGTYITGVYERPNVTSSGDYEYYGVADQYCMPSAAPNFSRPHENVVVFKLDETGAPTLSPNEFHYSRGAAIPLGYSYVQLTGIETSGGADDGIQVFCNDTLGENLLFVKSYFNGVSGCYDTILDMDNYHQGPDSLSTSTITVNGYSRTCPNISLIPNVLSISPSTLCAASSVGGGSNARLINGIRASSKKISGLDIYPIPTDGKIFLISEGEYSQKEIILILYDNIGRKIYETNIDHKLNLNSNKEVLDLESLNLDKGIYYLNVINGNNKEVFKVMYLSAD